VRPPESQTTTATQLTRIAWLSARDKQKTFQSLLHHFNETSLKACFHQLDGRKAVGVDGVTKAAYAQHLDDNLTEPGRADETDGLPPRPRAPSADSQSRSATRDPASGDQQPGG
jgi:hypothetical protein